MKIKDIIKEEKIDRNGAQKPEVLPKNHRSWTAAEKRAWDNGDEMPFNTDIKNAIKKVKNILSDEKNYTVGDSGDAYAITAAEMRGAADESIIAIYTETNPVVKFYFRWNNSWFDSKGNKLTTTEALSDMRKLDPDKYGWAEINLKKSAEKQLKSGK